MKNIKYGTFKAKKPNKDDLCLISLVYNFKGNRFQYSTNVFVTPKQWETIQTSKVSSTSIKHKPLRDINDKIEPFRDKLNTVLNESKEKGKVLSVSELREIFNEWQLPKDETLIISKLTELMDLWITDKFDSKKITESTKRRWNSVLSNVKRLEKYSNKKIKLDSLDNFYDDFIKYCRTDKIIDKVEVLAVKNNTIQSNLKAIRSCLIWGNEKKHIDTDVFKNWKKLSNDVNSEILTNREYRALRSFDFSKKKRLEKVRDVFVFGCETGARFSDYNNVDEVDINNGFWNLTPLKTLDKKINIPLSSIAISILKKYNYNLPSISNEKFNIYIKEVCKIIGIDDDIKVISAIGKKRNIKIVPKYNLISTHTARRFFITDALNKGIPRDVVKSISGHKSDNAFSVYVKISDEMKAQAIKELESRREEAENTSSNLKVV